MSDEKFSELIGKTLEEAQAMVGQRTLQVVERDGKQLAIHRNHNSMRINLVVENDLITEIRGMG